MDTDAVQAPTLMLLKNVQSFIRFSLFTQCKVTPVACDNVIAQKISTDERWSGCFL